MTKFIVTDEIYGESAMKLALNRLREKNPVVRLRRLIGEEEWAKGLRIMDKMVSEDAKVFKKRHQMNVIGKSKVESSPTVK